jgi:hypothetical protein
MLPVSQENSQKVRKSLNGHHKQVYLQSTRNGIRQEKAFGLLVAVHINRNKEREVRRFRFQ